MLCEEHREELTSAAATGAALSPELQRHVEACAACRRFQEEQRRLFADIDLGVRALVNTDVTAALIPRIRTQLKEETATPTRFLIPVWLGTAALAVIIAMVAFRAERPGRRAPLSKPAPDMVAGAEVRVPPSDYAARRGTEKKLYRRAPKRREVQSGVGEAVVLLPGGEKASVDTLLSNLRDGRVDAAVLLARSPESPRGELEIAPIEVSPIVVKPLVEEGGETTPASPTASR